MLTKFIVGLQSDLYKEIYNSIINEPARWRTPNFSEGYYIYRDDGMCVWLGSIRSATAISQGTIEKIGNRDFFESRFREIWGGVTFLSVCHLSPAHDILRKVAKDWIMNNG